MGARKHWDGDFDAAVEIAKLQIICSLERDITFAQLFIYRYHLKKNPQQLLALASKSQADHEAVRKVMADELQRGGVLPELALNWVVEYLRGQHPSPPKAAGRPSVPRLDIAITDAVRVVVDECGMSATRNDTTKRHSACDAVAQALSDLNLSPRSCQRVKKIWNNWIKAERSGDLHPPANFPD